MLCFSLHAEPGGGDQTASGRAANVSRILRCAWVTWGIAQRCRERFRHSAPCCPLVPCQDLIREKLAEAKQKQRQAQQGACWEAGLA